MFEMPTRAFPLLFILYFALEFFCDAECRNYPRSYNVWCEHIILISGLALKSSFCWLQWISTSKVLEPCDCGAEDNNSLDNVGTACSFQGCAMADRAATFFCDDVMSICALRCVGPTTTMLEGGFLVAPLKWMLVFTGICWWFHSTVILMIVLVIQSFLPET